MPPSPEPNEPLEIVKGAALLLGCHLVVGLFIFALGFVIGAIAGGYSILAVWLVGAMGFLFWQLLYVIPLILWLKRRGKTGMIKGVIIVAVLTALLNGACFLSFQR